MQRDDSIGEDNELPRTSAQGRLNLQVGREWDQLNDTPYAFQPPPSSSNAVLIFVCAAVALRAFGGKLTGCLLWKLRCERCDVFLYTFLVREPEHAQLYCTRGIDRHIHHKVLYYDRLVCQWWLAIGSRWYCRIIFLDANGSLQVASKHMAARAYGPIGLHHCTCCSNLYAKCCRYSPNTRDRSVLAVRPHGMCQCIVTSR